MGNPKWGKIRKKKGSSGCFQRCSSPLFCYQDDGRLMNWGVKNRRGSNSVEDHSHASSQLLLPPSQPRSSSWNPSPPQPNGNAPSPTTSPLNFTAQNNYNDTIRPPLISLRQEPALQRHYWGMLILLMIIILMMN
ncbi:hypothetical protein LIER_31596 [Lithospermum erythrorhizon]|uniref:Uncharacterized protein n=1 Tax=Lithospermum erythrorhizon TaxID=34254 RepID=A0AAV3RRG4_LITER